MRTLRQGEAKESISLAAFRHDAGRPSVDFAIITAKDVERDAVVCRLQACIRIEDPDEPYVYYKGRISVLDGSHDYEVVVAKLTEQGNVHAAAETTRLIQRWQPKNILMIGIAGGFAEKDVARGDVVIADYVHYYEPGKLTEEGEQRRPQQFRCDRTLYAKANNYDATGWKERLNTSLPADGVGFVPRVHSGPIGCGEKVITDPEANRKLLQECPKMVAVAMEGAGVAVATESERIPFLEIRGISDLADQNKTDEWQPYASNAAAAFMVGLLQSKPVTPLAEEERRGSNLKGRSLPVIVLRAQSLRQIGPEEILSAVPAELQGRQLESIPLDFTDLVAGADRRLASPEEAVQQLLNPQGDLIKALGRRNQAQLAFHGLVHVPLAFLAGYIVSDRQPVRLFDFHPSPGAGTWTWPEDGKEFPLITVMGLPRGKLRCKVDVVIRISISYPVSALQTRNAVPGSALEIDMTVPHPTRGIVTSEDQTRAYGRAFRQVLDRIANFSHMVQRVHVFYGGPVALAFHLGQQVSENIHPPIVVWNFRRGHYEWGIDITAATVGNTGIVWAADDQEKKEERS